MPITYMSAAAPKIHRINSAIPIQFERKKSEQGAISPD